MIYGQVDQYRGKFELGSPTEERELEIFNRDATMSEILNFLDIPRSLFPYDTCDCIGPSNPDFFHKYNERRKEKEDVAIASLEDLSDEEILELNEEQWQLHWFSRAHFLHDPPPWYAGGFGVEVHKADFAYWAKMDFWTLEEATCLSIGFKPEPMPNKKKCASAFEPLNFYHKRNELFNRADFNSAQSRDRIKPRELVEWALKKEIEIPNELELAVIEKGGIKRPAMLGTVDARKHDSALKVILGLIANEYGYRDGNVEKDIKQATMAGLANLGLNIDRKTLNRLFDEVAKSAKRFHSEQEKKDK